MTDDSAVKPSAIPWNVRLLAGALRLGARVPLRWLHALGGFVARLLILLKTREARVARRNAELVFPELDAAAREAFVRATLAETARSTLELAHVWGDARRALALIRDVQGRAHLDAALAQGKGVLIAAPHLGAWELLNLYLSTLAPLTILYRVPQRPEYESLLVGARSGLGAEAVRAEASGVRLLFRRLKEGRMVGILPDQRPKGGEGEWAPFFGRRAMTMTLLGRLAHKTGAPVVLGFAERLPQGAGFTIHFIPGDPAIGADDPIASVTALNQGIETLVRLAPTQYQWTYKRYAFWKPGDPPDEVYANMK